MQLIDLQSARLQTDEHIHWNTRVGTSYYHRQSALTPQSGLEHIVDKDLHIPQTQCQLTARDFQRMNAVVGHISRCAHIARVIAKSRQSRQSDRADSHRRQLRFRPRLAWILQAPRGYGWRKPGWAYAWFAVNRDNIAGLLRRSALIMLLPVQSLD